MIGAGASGLMAAKQAALARSGVKNGSGKVILLDGNPKPGKKLLATGNGKCNLTNLHISPDRYHGDKLARAVLEQFPAQRVLDGFGQMGLLTRADGEGRVYPRSSQSSAVLKALWDADGYVFSRMGAEVVSILPVSGGFLLEFKSGDKLFAKRCVLACGGKASPVHSMGGAGYQLARSLGHTVTPLSPSLVPLGTSSRACGTLNGMRTRAKVTLYQNGRPVYAESGEVIFGNGRLSGICVFNLSARLREIGLGGLEVGLDLLEEMDEPAVFDYLAALRKRCPQRKASELFFGALNFRVGQELLIELGLSSAKSMADMKGGELRRAREELRKYHYLLTNDKPISQLTDDELRRAARGAKDWRFPITGTGPWEDAQVTAGGVPLAEINLDTMESKVCPGLYLCGEMLDADGDCGGYNLHWAWATGFLAGFSAARGLTAERGRLMC